ncbi:protein of unknown function [Paenibacillus alvei]|uniref:Uncharacterized protein n=1 Tax=Paenibacillus alvei TaxID=44250 RepID=A0A383RGR6_PAEAL|nr:protein of unknown function [Paenibacillus alvei]
MPLIELGKPRTTIGKGDMIYSDEQFRQFRNISEEQSRCCRKKWSIIAKVKTGGLKTLKRSIKTH